MFNLKQKMKLFKVIYLFTVIVNTFPCLSYGAALNEKAITSNGVSSKKLTHPAPSKEQFQNQKPNSTSAKALLDITSRSTSPANNVMPFSKEEAMSRDDPANKEPFQLRIVRKVEEIANAFKSMSIGFYGPLPY